MAVNPSPTSRSSSVAGGSTIQLRNSPSPRPLNPAPKPPSPQTPRPKYYTDISVSLAKHFHNLDSDEVYLRFKSALVNPTTSNFIVDFGGAPEGDGGEAWCALNLNSSDSQTIEGIKKLLQEPRPGKLQTRWINIFSPHTQKELVQTIASHYGFTPRHTSILTEGPREPRPWPGVQPHPTRFDRFFHRQPATEPADVEGSGGPAIPDVLSGGHMGIVSNVWHWHAIEWGERFLCIGYNALHQLSEKETTDDDDDESLSYNPAGDGSAEPVNKEQNYPDGKRQWIWLVLCDDGTVLMLHEPPVTAIKQELAIIRRNLVSVFKSLSRSTTAMEDRAKSAETRGMEELPFRRGTTRGGRSDSENAESGPSLLFYYLFDDWYSSLLLVVGSGYPYSNRMRELRREMQLNPELSQLSRLHTISRQLAILKRMYETKKVIIDSILSRQGTSNKSPFAPQLELIPTGLSRENTFQSLSSSTWGEQEALGVPLTPLAIAKFERLRDRITIYALGEINECLQEKAELVDMTFNLISLREASSVEQLTRVAILLTKFAVVFVPLTLVTGYFSMQLRGMDGAYTQKTFWVTSFVLVTVTIIILFIIGKATDTLETGGMWKGFKNLLFKMFGRKGAKNNKKRRRRRETWRSW